MFITTVPSNSDAPGKATISLSSGDHVELTYMDPHGKTHTLCVDAQHLVLMVSHQESQAAMIMRPSVGVQFVQPQ